MSNTPNFICVQGTDYGAAEFTQGTGGKFVTSEEMYQNTTLPMCWAGFFKPQWLEICKSHNLKFYNLDSGYFGNKKRKTIFRLSVNNFQNLMPIVPRPADRWEKLQIQPESFNQGSDIVIVPPDRKIVHTLQLGTVDLWVQNVINDIKKYSDRPIRVRHRPEPRGDRVVTNTFKDFIRNNTHCVIGFSSNALVEAAMFDIPVIALGHSATKSLYSTSLDNIEKLRPADKDHKQAWLNHLAYSQFTREEFLSGMAKDFLS